MTRKELEYALGIKISILKDKGCWYIKDRDWSNYTTTDGELAHRKVYKLCKDKLIEGFEICHTCDRKGCIHPDHLFQGTHSDNMKDARNKKRGWLGWDIYGKRAVNLKDLRAQYRWDQIRYKVR